MGRMIVTCGASSLNLGVDLLGGGGEEYHLKLVLSGIKA